MAERNVLLKNVKHPFLVGLHYSFQTADKLYFVLDFVNGGEVSCLSFVNNAVTQKWVTGMREAEGFPSSGIICEVAHVSLAVCKWVTVAHYLFILYVYLFSYHFLSHVFLVTRVSAGWESIMPLQKTHVMISMRISLLSTVNIYWSQKAQLSATTPLSVGTYGAVGI